jgi:hypothetical protein
MNPAPSIGMLEGGRPNALPCASGVYRFAFASSLSDLELDADGGTYLIGVVRHYVLKAEP